MTNLLDHYIIHIDEQWAGWQDHYSGHVDVCDLKSVGYILQIIKGILKQKYSEQILFLNLFLCHKWLFLIIDCNHADCQIAVMNLIMSTICQASDFINDKNVAYSGEEYRKSTELDLTEGRSLQT